MYLFVYIRCCLRSICSVFNRKKFLQIEIVEKLFKINYITRKIDYITRKIEWLDYM